MKPLLAILGLALAAAATLPVTPVTFVDVTSKAGIRFTHNAGRTGKKFLPETLGAGCAFIDADGDGWPDIVLVNGKNLKPGGKRTISALYRNNHDGTFTDVTGGS